MSPALESSGFIRGPVVPHRAMSPFHQKMVHQGISYVCCYRGVLLLWWSCICFQSSLQWLSACCGQSLVPVVLVGQSRAA